MYVWYPKLVKKNKGGGLLWEQVDAVKNVGGYRKSIRHGLLLKNITRGDQNGGPNNIA